VRPGPAAPVAAAPVVTAYQAADPSAASSTGSGSVTTSATTSGGSSSSSSSGSATSAYGQATVGYGQAASQPSTDPHEQPAQEEHCGSSITQYVSAWQIMAFSTFMMFLCMLFFIVGCGANNWVSYNFNVPGGSWTAHYGVWQTCISGQKCDDIMKWCSNDEFDVCGKVRSARFFTLMPFFTALTGFVFMIMLLYKDKFDALLPCSRGRGRLFRALVVGLGLASALMGGIGTATWNGCDECKNGLLGSGARFVNANGGYDFAYRIEIAAWILCFIFTGAWALAAYLLDRSSDEPTSHGHAHADGSIHHDEHHDVSTHSHGSGAHANASYQSL